MKRLITLAGTCMLAVTGMGAAAFQDQDMRSIVEARLAELREQNPTEQREDPMAKVMSDGYLTMNSQEIFNNGSVGWAQMSFSDGNNEVTVYGYRNPGEAYQFDWASLNGVRIEAETAVQIGNYYEFVNPELASVTIQARIAANDFPPQIQGERLQPGSLNTAWDGVTIYVWDEGVALIANTGFEITAVQNLLTPEVVVVERAAAAAAQAQPRPNPRKRVCDHLLNICLQGNGHTSVVACEAWLRLCGGGGNNNPD